MFVICIFLMTKDTELFSICLFAIPMSSNIFIISFKNWAFFLIIEFWGYYINRTQFLYYIYLTDFFSLLAFWRAKWFNFDRVQLSFFLLCLMLPVWNGRNPYLIQDHNNFHLFSSESFIILGFTSMSVIRFDLIFVDVQLFYLFVEKTVLSH